MKILSIKEESIAKSWLHDVLYWGGLLSKAKRSTDKKDYQYTYGDNNHNDAEGKKAATEVCDFIKEVATNSIKYRSFVRLGHALKVLSRNKFCDLNDSKIIFSKDQETLALYVAHFLKNMIKMPIYVNQLKVIEMNEIKENTIVGKVFSLYNLFEIRKEEKVNEDHPELFFEKYIKTEEDYEAFEEALYSSMN